MKCEPHGHFQGILVFPCLLQQEKRWEKLDLMHAEETTVVTGALLNVLGDRLFSLHKIPSC